MNTETHTPGPWRDSTGGRGRQLCEFLLEGCKYAIYRDGSGIIDKVCKRQRTNARGVYYQPLNMSGTAARKVLASFLGMQS